GKLWGSVFARFEPMAICSRFFQEPVARAQRSLERIDAARMFGVDRERQTIEKTPALRGRAVKQAVHRRNQPYDSQVISESRSRGHRFSIDAALAYCGCRVLRRRVNPGAQRRQSEGALDFRSYCPRAVAFIERDFAESGAAQAAAGGQKRDCFDQVGLAGAVWSDQCDRTDTGLERGAAIVAEIMQVQAADECRHRFGFGPQAAAIPDDRLPILVKLASASGHRARHAAPCPG